MQFSDIAEVFDRVESTGSRLEMAAILGVFFRPLPPADLRRIVYLSSGRLHPEFDPRELGMADKLVVKTIAAVSGRSQKEVDDLVLKTGDPGEAAEALVGKKRQMTLFSEPLTLDSVVDGLSEIESANGKDSQKKKTGVLSRLLHDAGSLEARYICRIVTGRMRVGAGAMTLMDALCAAFATKEDKPEVERAYNVTCDMGLVAETLASGGMDAVRAIGVTVGDPIKVMLAERMRSILEILERMGGRCALEYKYDGIRVQAHIRRAGEVRMYSRRLEDLSANFADVGESLKCQMLGTEAIVEGECVAFDPETGQLRPFQNVTHRRRKNDMSEAIEQVPVRIFLFDLLFLDGKDYTTVPYPERRAKLETLFSKADGFDRVGFAEQTVVGSVEEAQAFFDRSVESRCEGIMAKSLSDQSIYKAGARGFLWIKYKKDYTEALVDTFDLAVVGAFYGMGKRAGVYGALLMAVYDQDSGRWCTACKLGTGFDEAFLNALPGMLESYRSETKPSSVSAEMVPDVWFLPGVVLEVTAADISISPIHTAAYGVVKEDAGLGLRFPRFTGRVRDDKSPEQCTTSEEVREFYEIQEARNGSSGSGDE